MTDAKSDPPTGRHAGPYAASHSVSRWLAGVREGDAVAAQRLWERYFQRLVRYARRRLGSTPKRSGDEEDVALGAFDSFFRAAEAGRFPKLDGRDDLWRILLRLTARKAVDLQRHEGAAKRRHLDEAAIDGDHESRQLAQFLGDEPDPAVAAAVADECERLLGALPEDLRELAIARMEGYAVEEIARDQDCSVRTVERRLRLIRKTWQQGEDG